MSSDFVLAPVLAGNWKQNKGPAESAEFFARFLELYPRHSDRTVIFFPPAVSLAAAARALADRSDVWLGIQNIHWEATGAFTGEIGGPMAREAGARFVLCGHSERRHIFGESDEAVGRKARAALDADLIPVVCVGEKLDERRTGRLESVLARQLNAVITALDDTRSGGAAMSTLGRILLAYEPVWAIGTGVTATPADAAAAHAFLRTQLASLLGEQVAAGVPILYGGSVKPDNAAELLAASDVDGLLVGGASLDAAAFARIAAVDMH
jgi:triosephosphate isomerase